jgi:ATP-dependent Lhr-like helicase
MREVPAERILRRYLRNSGPLTRDDILARYAFDPAWLDETLAALVASGEILQGHFVASEPPTDQSTELPIYQPPLQFCDRHNLEQILRRTLASLRREVQPVPLAAYADFLTRWQGIHPERRSSGVEGLRRAMGQLRGLPLPGVIWERDVLPARVGDYEPGAPSTSSELALNHALSAAEGAVKGQALAALCETGELVWVGSGRDPRRGRVCFFGRGEGRLFLLPAALDLSSSELSPAARSVYDYLAGEGASFLADLQTGLGLQENELQDALAELAMAGLVTNDTLDALNAVLEHGMGATGTPRAFGSTLAAELTALRGGERRPLLPGRINRERYHAAKRRVVARLKAETGVNAWAGRWSLVHRAAVLGPPLDDETRGERLARVLLARYGVIMRETVEREAGSWDWPLVSLPLQRMELRGEVRRGYFVQGLSGVQYALPDAVEALRAAAASPADAMVVLNAADPANPYGGEFKDPPAFARVPSTHLVLWQGRPVLVAEDNGERLTAAADLGDDLLRRAADAYLRRPNAPRRLLVRQWNGAAALDSPAEALLQPLGFSRTPNGLEWWAGS